jgi:hypothetical protein
LIDPRRQKKPVKADVVIRHKSGIPSLWQNRTTNMTNANQELSLNDLDQVSGGNYYLPHNPYPFEGFHTVWLGNGAALIEKNQGRDNDFRNFGIGF